MFDCFYIVEPQEGWYRLHMKGNHYCLGSSNNLEALENTLKRLVKKYKTKERLMRSLSLLGDKGLVNDKVKKIYAEEYEQGHLMYDGLVKTIVSTSLGEVKSDTPFNRARKKLRPALSEDLTPTPPTPKISAKEVVTIKTPKVLKRKRILSV